MSILPALDIQCSRTTFFVLDTLSGTLMCERVQSKMKNEVRAAFNSGKHGMKKNDISINAICDNSIMH